jgi:hypothetical protein
VATGLPIGSLDDAAVGPGRVSVAGWSLDPDGADPIQVTVTIDDVPHTLVANGLRPDIDQALPGYGPRHGFAGSFGVSGGFHMVCAYGLDASTGTRSLLGCRGVVVPTGPPVGSVDQVTRSGSIVTVAGWALDPDTADPIDVHLVVGSQILPVHASIIRPDVGLAFPGYGSSHGFVATFSAASPVSVCAFAINIGGGSNTLLGCRAV